MTSLPRHLSLVRLPVIALLAFLAAGLSAHATVLIYKLDFTQTGPQVNYPDPRWGYAVVDPDASTFVSVVVLLDPFTRNLYYSTNLLSGRFFEATPLRRGGVHDVMSSAFSSQNAEFFALQIAGVQTRTYSVGGGKRYRLAGMLEGTLLMSGSDMESEETQFTREGIIAELGFVGTANVVAKYQRNASRRANDRGDSVAEALKLFIDELESTGIKPLEQDETDPEVPIIPDPLDPLDPVVLIPDDLD